MLTFHNVDDIDTDKDFWLIHNILPSGDICMLSGESEDLNTLIATYFSLHVSCGQQWLGHNVNLKCAVYIGNQYYTDIINYRRDWMITNGVESNTDFHLTIETVDYSEESAYDISYGLHNLLVRDGHSKIPSLIVIDLQATPLNMQNSQNAKAVLKFARILQEEHCATILLVHKEDSINECDGYNLVLNNIDVAMRVEPLGDDCLIRFKKMRDHQLPTPFLVKNCSLNYLGSK